MIITFISAETSSLFLATIGAETIKLDNEPIPWDTAVINYGGHFDTVLGAYFAPADGLYQ